MPDSGNPEAKASPNLPWTTRLFMSAVAFAVDVSCRPNMTCNRRLFNLVDLKCSASSQPKNGVKSFDFVIDSDRNLWFRLYTPTNVTETATTSSLPVIVYFHGGGFVLLAANSKRYDDHCRRLAKEIPAVVISVNYRLAPENRYPSQYDDGIDVLKFIDTKISTVEDFPACADLKRCFVAGDSAGGNLAHNVAVRANECKFSKLKLIGVIAIQPFFGGEERTQSEEDLNDITPLVSLRRSDWMWTAFLPEGTDRDYPAANTFGKHAVDISRVDIPATIVIVGGFDPLKDWQKRHYQGLKRHGKEAYLIEYPNAVHGFYIFPELHEGSFIDDVGNFIRDQSAKS
ncbi:hypothetical protein WN944_015403 [Citrus x changshan-huyou]|uniref:Alpha/beta hydrolase fold-3 domain-containing protein n=1 Tax=Citrus x changshan-huyou TaxID=2935761 RepID=A0AAP0M904_9ROSI